MGGLHGSEVVTLVVGRSFVGVAGEGHEHLRSLFHGPDGAHAAVARAFAGHHEVIVGLGGHGLQIALGEAAQVAATGLDERFTAPIGVEVDADFAGLLAHVAVVGVVFPDVFVAPVGLDGIQVAEIVDELVGVAVDHLLEGAGGSALVAGIQVGLAQVGLGRLLAHAGADGLLAAQSGLGGQDIGSLLERAGAQLPELGGISVRHLGEFIGGHHMVHIGRRSPAADQVEVSPAAHEVRLADDPLLGRGVVRELLDDQVGLVVELVEIGIQGTGAETIVVHRLVRIGGNIVVGIGFEAIVADDVPGGVVHGHGQRFRLRVRSLGVVLVGIQGAQLLHAVQHFGTGEQGKGGNRCRKEIGYLFHNTFHLRV